MSIFTVIDFVTSSLASHLWDPVITNMKYLTKMEENIEKLDSTVKSLEARKHEIQIRLRNSERKQEICNPEVIEWIEKVAAMKNEVKEMKNGQKKRRQPFNYWSKFETGTRAAKKLKEAEMLHEKGAFKHVSIEIPPYHVQEVPTVPVTKETYYNLIKILHCLKDEKVGTVGIWGMGGVGKTTLLRKINNHFLGVTR
jgi:disease resistance protein RPS2